MVELVKLFANSEDLDQKQPSAASNVGLRCLSSIYLSIYPLLCPSSISFLRGTSLPNEIQVDQTRNELTWEVRVDQKTGTSWPKIGTSWLRYELRYELTSYLRVASGPRVKLASCKNVLNPPVVYSTDRSKAVVPVLVLLFVALWFILRGDLFYVLPCVILFLCFSVLLPLQLPRLGKRELILVLFVCLFDLWLFGFVCFLFLLVSGKGCGLPWFNYWFSFTLAYNRISHEYSSLFIIVINLIFMFSLWCIDWVRSLYANRIFMCFCLKSSIGTQGEVS